MVQTIVSQFLPRLSDYYSLINKKQILYLSNSAPSYDEIKIRIRSNPMFDAQRVFCTTAG
jgi:hypothetical protein